jgi:PEP-CTERM motif
MLSFTRVFAAIAIAFLSALIAAAPGHATVISRTIEFTASDLDFSAPVDPVVGSFSITFDNAVTVLNQTSGIGLISLNIVLEASGVGFDYFSGGDDTLVIGGVLGGVSTISGNVDDFLLVIDNVSTAPVFQFFFYSQADAINNAHFARNLNGTVGPIAVPEPASLALLGAGIVAAALSRRRKGAKAAEADAG